MEWLNPGRWLLYICAFMALLLGLWRTVEILDERGYNRAVAEYRNMSNQEVINAERRHQLTLNEANSASTLRQKELTDLAARNAATAASLRQQNAAIRSSLPTITRDAVNAYAATASVVFEECTGKYSELAEQAGELANERQELIEAWPK